MNIMQFVKRYIRNKFHVYSNAEIKKSSKISESNIYVEDGSRLVVGELVNLKNVTIHLTGNSELIIGDNCKISDAGFNIINSVCNLSDGVIIRQSNHKTNTMVAENSTINIANRVRLNGVAVYSRFKSILEIGENSGFSAGVEIFCHETIKIGKSALIAEDVCIYDTNTHSTESAKRVAEMAESYPNGLWDKQKPDTAPIILGDNVWLGKGASILKGVSLGNNCIVGMRTSVGRGNYEEGTILVSANPVAIKRK